MGNIDSSMEDQRDEHADITSGAASISTTTQEAQTKSSVYDVEEQVTVTSPDGKSTTRTISFPNSGNPPPSCFHRPTKRKKVLSAREKNMWKPPPRNRFYHNVEVLDPLTNQLVRIDSEEESDLDDDGTLESESPQMHRKFFLEPDTFQAQLSLEPLVVALEEAIQLDSLPHPCHIPPGSGCLLHMKLQSPSSVTKKMAVWKTASMHHFVWKDLDLDQCVSDFLDHPTETTRNVTRATQLWSTTRSQPTNDNEAWYGMVEDVLWWQHRSGAVPLYALTKLRRMLLPVTLLVTSTPGPTTETNKSDASIPPVEAEGPKFVLIQQLYWSLADKIVAEKGANRNAFLRAVLRTLQLLKQLNYSQLADMESIVLYQEMQQLLVSTCHKAGGSFLLEAQSIDLEKLGMMDVPLPRINTNNQQSYSEERAADMMNIQERRKNLLSEQEEWESAPHYRNPSQHVITQQSNGMTEEEYLAETNLMHRVNSTFPRQFDPVDSRPRFAHSQLTAQELAKLNSIFFHDDGRLKESCINDASKTLRNHYIIFCNDSGAGAKDKRWQIPIQSHLMGSVPTRSLVENILFRSGVLDARCEKITELILIIGGTQDQSLHHDMPRNWVVWRASNGDLDNETVGWESDRLQYNHAMASKHAPAAMLLPMQGASECNPAIEIAVQRDQIVKCRESSPQRCHIRNGDPCETFEIVRESKHLVVLKIPKGCIFTGDFPHAGVSLGDTDKNLKARLERLCLDFDQILGDENLHHDRRNAVLRYCTHFPGLNQLCRLYIATDQIDEKALNAQQNTIGYYGCYSNQPTERV